MLVRWEFSNKCPWASVVEVLRDNITVHNTGLNGK